MERWEDVAIRLNHLAAQLAGRGLARSHRRDSPSAIATLLIKRAATNFGAFFGLREGGFDLEADIILRSLIETTICALHLRANPDEFTDQLKRDRAATMLWHAKRMEEEQESDQARALAREISDHFGSAAADGVKYRSLDWKRLAEAAGAERLYHSYRELAGSAVHVSGISLEYRSVGGPKHVDELRQRSLQQACTVLTLAIEACAVSMDDHEFDDELEGAFRWMAEEFGIIE